MPKICVYLFSEKQKSLFSATSSSGKTYCEQIMICDRSKKKPNDLQRDDFFMNVVENAPHNDYILICYDKMLSHLSSEDLYNCLEYCCSEINFDLLFLASWAEHPECISDIHDYRHIKIMKTLSPHGTSCILFSPTGRRRFLDEIEIDPYRSLTLCLNPQLKKLQVYSTYPSLVEFDITERESHLELIKCCKYREVPSAVRPPKLIRRNTTTLSLLWFILVLIIIICITAILLTYADAPKMKNLSISAPYPPYDPIGDIGSYLYP
jgi:hypothetical protein